MIDMNPERWEYITQYLNDVFGNQDEHLSHLMENAVQQGLPNIAISAPVGRLLMMLKSMTRGRLGIEVGTLAGYSGIWIARGLRPGGRLITIEMEPAHADFAQAQFLKAGVADRVEIRRGVALEVLAELAAELSPGSVDLVFLDAVKIEYPEYWRLVRPLIAPGGVILIDNVIGGSEWKIDQRGHPSREAAAQVSHMIADDPDFEAVAVPIREGVLIGRRNNAINA